jgi:hypothetical protein
MARSTAAPKPEADATPDAATESAAPDTANGGVSFVDELPEDEHKTERDSKYAVAVRVLRENPGKWGKVVSAKNRNGARTRCYQLQKKYPATKTDAKSGDVTAGFDWTYRNNDVFGMFVAE